MSGCIISSINVFSTYCHICDESCNKSFYNDLSLKDRVVMCSRRCLDIYTVKKRAEKIMNREIRVAITSPEDKPQPIPKKDSLC